MSKHLLRLWDLLSSANVHKFNVLLNQKETHAHFNL